jgi:hypothetical protein
MGKNHQLSDCLITQLSSKMGLLYTSLFWIISVTTCMSGGLGFLLKIPNFYHPDVYLVGHEMRPGTGTTAFEEVATLVFGLIYVGPLVGMLFAHIQGRLV